MSHAHQRHTCPVFAWLDVEPLTSVKVTVPPESGASDCTAWAGPPDTLSLFQQNYLKAIRLFPGPLKRMDLGM